MGISFYSNRGSVDTIPTPIKASSIEGLRKTMKALNRRFHGFIIYMGQPMWVDKEKSWVAWYYIDKTLEETISEVTRVDSEA